MAHAREDHVRRPVDDRIDARDAIRRQALAEQGDDGKAGADRGFEPEPRAVLCGKLSQLRALVRDEQFVRRHHRLARCKRALDERCGRLATADDLDDDADVRVVDHRCRVGDERHAFEVHSAGTRGVTHGNAA